MAKRKTKSRSTSTRIVQIPARQSAPIIKVSAPRAPAKRKASRRRRVGGGGGSSLMPGSGTLGIGAGGALYGFAVKSGWVAKLPAIPVIGRTGTAAILLDYWGKRGGGQMVKNAALAAAAIAGYQLGSEGSIMGGGGQHFATAGYDGYYTGDAGTEYEDEDEEYEEDEDEDDDDGDSIVEPG
jgi:hypothetical protein